MTQPPYGQGSDPYQRNPDQSGSPGPEDSGYGAAPQTGSGYDTQSGYGESPGAGYGIPAAGGYGAPYQGGPGTASHGQAGPPGSPPYGPPQAPKSKTGLIVAAVVAVVAIAGVILAVVLINKAPSPRAVVQGDDAALNALSQSCFDGEMSACDDLFLQSPVGSDYEDYGNTCGGRIEESDVDSRYCVDIF